MTSAQESLQSQLQSNRGVDASDEAYTSITRKAGEGFARAFGSVKRKANRATSNVTGIFSNAPGDEKSNGSPLKSHNGNTPKMDAPLSPFNSASKALRHARSSLETQTKGQNSPGRFGSLRRVAHSTIGRTRQSLSVGRKEDLPFPIDPEVHRSSPIAVPPALNLNSLDIPSPSMGELNDLEGLQAWQQELRDATIVVGSIPKPALPDVAMHLAKASRSAPKRSPRPPPLNISLEGSPKRLVPDAQPTPLPGTTFSMGDLDDPSSPRSRLPTEIEDYPILSGYAEDAPKPEESPPERPNMTGMKITTLPFRRLTHGKPRKSVDSHFSPGRPQTPPPKYEAVSSKSRRPSPHPRLHDQLELESPTAESSIPHISTTPTSYFHKIQRLKDPNAGHVNHITGAWQSEDSTTIVPGNTDDKPLLMPHITFDEPLVTRRPPTTPQLSPALPVRTDSPPQGPESQSKSEDMGNIPQPRDLVDHMAALRLHYQPPNTDLTRFNAMNSIPSPAEPVLPPPTNLNQPPLPMRQIHQIDHAAIAKDQEDLAAKKGRLERYAASLHIRAVQKKLDPKTRNGEIVAEHYCVGTTLIKAWSVKVDGAWRTMKEKPDNVLVGTGATAEELVEKMVERMREDDGWVLPDREA